MKATQPTKGNTMTESERTTERTIKHEQISNLAESYLDEAMASGDAFSEALCNWAIDKAEQELGSA